MRRMDLPKAHVVPLLPHQKREILFRNIVKSGIAAAFRAFEVGKLELKLAQVLGLEQADELALAFGARERDENRLHRPAAEKIRDQVDLFDDRGRAFLEKQLRTLGPD